MRDPTPVAWLLLLQGLALLALAGWWVGLRPADRLLRLATIMARERVATAPPDGLVAQAQWLSRHRLTHLQGFAGLGLVALVIGIGEGSARRQTDVLGGFLRSWWIIGVCLAALVPGAVAGYLVVPWVLMPWMAACGLAVLLALVMYGLLAGRPYVP